MVISLLPQYLISSPINKDLSCISADCIKKARNKCQVFELIALLNLTQTNAENFLARRDTSCREKRLVGQSRNNHETKKPVMIKLSKYHIFLLRYPIFNIIAYIKLAFSRKNKNHYLCKCEISSRKKKCSTITDLIFLKKINNTTSFFQIL